MTCDGKLWVGEGSIDVEIEYEVVPGSRGYREHGVQIEPDEEEDIEIVAVRWNGIRIDVPKEGLEKLEAQVWKEIQAI